VVDLDWNRKSIFEKLDWLKEAIEDLISKGNHNIDAQQKQILDITARLSALEKPVRKSPRVAKTQATKKPGRASVRTTKRPAPSKRNR
jgi:hypothetical protein